MKKLLSIVFIFIPVYITSASGANTKKVTANLSLGVPDYKDSGYEYKHLRTLDVSIQDSDCTFDQSNLPVQSTYTDAKHISIGAIDLDRLQGNSINKNISLICKEEVPQLNLQFSFTYQGGNVDTEEQITIQQFSLNKDINKNSALFNGTVPTSYQEKQEIITKAAANLCSGGEYKQTKNSLCCTDGFFDTNDQEVKEAYYSLKEHEITPSICPTDTGTMNVSGTVVDEKNNEPLPYANIAILDNPSKGTSTDENGNFTLSDVPLDKKLKILYVGYETKEIFPSRNITIKMTPTSTTLSEFKVIECGPDTKNGIKAKQRIDGECYPSECVEPRWKLSGTDKEAQCVERKCNIKNGTGEWTADGDTWKCTVKSCDKNYKENSDKTECAEILKECTDDQKKQHPNATKTGIKKGTQDCIAQECKCGFKLEGEKCVEWTENEPCTADTKPKLPGNAKSAIMKCDGEKAYCEITDCNDGYKVSEDKKSCVSTRGDDCDATAVDPNATAGTNKNVKGKITCVITDCAHGFAPNKDGTKCVAGELSESDSLAKIDELRDNATAMRNKEQSTANKLLGATGIGATGIGGMQMASAMAEENADADAERAMRAYLATFHCNYGAGKNIAGGETNVELPGGNELISLYSEYVNLANDLKARKTALDLRPGIESESILDAATSGLYDDVAIGKTSGAYTSLARALMDPTGADAAAWAAQKKETADKKKTGMITAGIGAAGSLVGNLATNSGKDKQNKVDEILNKYKKLKQTFDAAQQEFDEIPGQPCSDFDETTGTGTAPNCECIDKTNKRFSKENGGCIACENGKVYNKSNTCVCPSNKPREVNGTCEAQLPECTLTGLVTSNECKCIDNATAVSNECKCNNSYTKTNDACVQDTVPPVEKTETLVSPVALYINSDTAFVSGKANLTNPKGQNALNNFISEIKAKNSELSDGNFCITITGHTDRVPFRKTVKKNNEQLSLERANKIKEELLKDSLISDNNIKTIGKGDTECKKDKYPNDASADCRHVDIVLTSGACQP